MICTWMQDNALNAHLLTPISLVDLRQPKTVLHPSQATGEIGVSYLTDTARGGIAAASPAVLCFIDKGSCPDAEQVRELGEYYKEGPPFGKRTL